MRQIRLKIVSFFFLLSCSTVSCQDFANNLLKTLGVLYDGPDYGLLTPELVTNRGFGYERHYVYVSDGFILGVHRIINPLITHTRSTILFGHGVTGSSDNFLDDEYSGFINEPKDFMSGNIGFELAKRGHDVWLLDQRATYFSSNNTQFNKRSPGFWDWSLDQIALLDLPATIEYIRIYTGRSIIGYIGHSQGTGVMFMLMSRMPQYNFIIKPFIAIAPIFFLADTIFTRAPELRNLPYDALEQTVKQQNSPFIDDMFTTTVRFLCSSRIIMEAVCKPIFYTYLTFLSPLVIPTPPNIEYSRVPVYASSSLYFTVSNKQVGQYFQIILGSQKGDLPRQFSLSIDENRRIYVQDDAPVYDPKRINCPNMVFLSAESDVLSTPKDVQRLLQVLPVQPVRHYKINDPAFGHLTFIFGQRQYIVPFVVTPIVQVLDVYYPTEK